MLLGNGDINVLPDLTVKEEVEHSQIEFINSNRINSVTTMAFGAIFLYFFLGPQIDSYAIFYWLGTILLVDVFRLYAAVLFRIDKKNNRVNYHLAALHILIGTILSGLCWGSLAVITIPVIDGPGMMILLLMLVVIATASTTTLSYQLKYTVIFVMLVLSPVMLTLPGQLYFTGSQLWLLELALFVLTIFLLKKVQSLNLQH